MGSELYNNRSELEIKMEVDSTMPVDRKLSADNKSAKREHIQDENIKDEIIPKRHKSEHIKGKLEVKPIKLEDEDDEVKLEDIKHAKREETTASYNGENKPDIKLGVVPNTNIKLEDIITHTPDYEDEEEPIIKLEEPAHLPNEGSPYQYIEPYQYMESIMDTKIEEDIKSPIPESSKDVPAPSIEKGEDEASIKSEFSEDANDSSNRNTMYDSMTTNSEPALQHVGWNSPYFNSIQWSCSPVPNRAAASLSASPFALSSPEQSPTPSGGEAPPPPTPNPSQLSSPASTPDPESEDESDYSSSSSGYYADRSESMDSDSDETESSSPLGSSRDSSSSSSLSSASSSDESDSPQPSSSQGRSIATRITTPMSSASASGAARTPYVSNSVAPQFYFRDFYPQPIPRQPGAARITIRFYRRNFFDRPAMSG